MQQKQRIKLQTQNKDQKLQALHNISFTKVHAVPNEHKRPKVQAHSDACEFVQMRPSSKRATPFNKARNMSNGMESLH